MRKKIKNVFCDKNLTIREMLYRKTMQVSFVGALLAMLRSITMFDLHMAVFYWGIIAIAIIVALVGIFDKRKLEFSAIMLGVILNGIFLPFAFFTSGGIHGGAVVWLVLGLIYWFTLFYGKKMVLLEMLTLLLDVTMYLLAQYYPDRIISLESEKISYLDSIISVIYISIAVSIVLRYQITLAKKEQEIIQRQKEQLEEISNSKDVFFSNISHDIRTPINTIIGLNEMILRKQQSDETREYSEKIEIASKTLLKLVENILDISQIQMKKMEICPVEYHVEEFVTEMVDIVKEEIKDKKLLLKVKVSPETPSVLYGDRKRISQVIFNILSNAVKYTDEGTISFEIYSEIIEDDKVVLRIKVVDTGHGIRKEDIDFLYDVFRRDSKTKNQSDGSRFGLSITRKLVDLMGGTISVDSIYTKGTTFTVELEQRIVNKEPIGKKDFLNPQKNGEQGGYRKLFEAPEARILVVDDNALNIMVVEKMLEDTKIKIDIAESGSDCLEKTMKKYYDVILLDYLMLDMTGGEVLNKLRKQENGLCRNSSVILLSANSIEESMKICEKYQFDAFMEKPINGHLLEKKILQFIPEDIVENDYSLYDDAIGTSSTENGKKRKICITSDCICDLNEEITKEYNIRLMYLYIRTLRGRFADTREIATSNMSKYLSEFGDNPVADSASVEEYENFFAEALSEAEQVIHISVAKNTGKTYSRACMAAKGFDHVKVIDSGQISCGQALLVLKAAKMANEGYSVKEIINEIEKMKEKIFCKYIMPDVEVFYNSGRISPLKAAIVRTLHVNPILEMKHSNVIVTNAEIGDIKKARRHLIKKSFRRKRRVDKSMLLISHIACSENELKEVQKEIAKRVKFEKVIVLNASVSSACNAAIGCIGIAYYQGDGS